MSNPRKTLDRILSGQADASIAFNDLLRLLEKLGFTCRIKGSHHIFHQSGIEEILNLQPKGSQAKSYQVRQVRNVVLKYQLSVAKNA
ncbi:MAG: type II toxin-antitoxin system HicA family toxin [Opitutaceae bacterium]|nr:type II toxin-antitoxin system HicA family toxin [Opitutaceae bacterium]